RAVDGDQRRQLALLGEDLDERLAHPRRHVPVDRPDLVAGLVRPNLGKSHSPALEHRVVPAGERVLHGAPGGDLDAADLPDEVGGRGHYGTSIFSRILWMIFSDVRFSASAS